MASTPPLAPALRDTLAAVAGALAEAAEPWWVIAGAACALHGIAADARDVDVLLAGADARRLLPQLGVALAPGAPDARFRSDLFGTWHAPPLPVEFMAGFRLSVGATWPPVVPATRQAFAIGEAIVHAPDRAELRRLLQAFGRPADLARAALLI